MKSRVLPFVISLGLLVLQSTPVRMLAQTATPPAPTPTTAQAGATFSTERIRCPAPLTVAEKEGETYHCGVVYLPENYAKPSGRIIELTFLVLHSTSLTPDPDPVVYLSGGPGGSALSEMSNEGTGLRVSFAKIRERRDVVTFDQRGDRYSSMLPCSSFYQLVKSVPAEVAQNPTYQKFISEFQLLDADRQEVFSIGLCGRALKVLGTDIGQYHSTISVRDIAEVVKAAGYTGQYNLYGISYGTRLALTAMRDTPRNIRSVVLDSTYPPEVQSYETAELRYVVPFQEVFRLCRENTDCNASYPNIEQRFIDLLTQMVKQPLKVDPPINVEGTLVGTYLVSSKTITQVTPSFFVNIAKISNNSPGGGWMAYVPAIVHYLEAGDVQTVIDLLNGEITMPVAPPLLTPELQKVQELQQADVQIQTNIRALLEQNQKTDIAARPAAQWLKVVTDYLGKQSAPDNGLTLPTLAFFWLPVYTQTAQTLTEFGNDSLDATTAKAANAIVAKMTTDDVREAFNYVRSITIKSVGVEGLTALGQQFGVECYEEVPFQDAERAKRLIATLPYPGLFNATTDRVNSTRQLCNILEPARPPAIENQRVVSSIPVLIYQGLIDTQTTSSWGPSAAKGLRNSTLVYVPDSGHSVIPKTDCAQSVAAHFFDRPGTKLNTSCIKTTLPFPSVEMIESLKAKPAASATVTSTVASTATVTATSTVTATVTPTVAPTATPGS